MCYLIKWKKLNMQSENLMVLLLFQIDLSRLNFGFQTKRENNKKKKKKVKSSSSSLEKFSRMLEVNRHIPLLQVVRMHTKATSSKCQTNTGIRVLKEVGTEVEEEAECNSNKDHPWTCRCLINNKCLTNNQCPWDNHLWWWDLNSQFLNKDQCYLYLNLIKPNGSKLRMIQMRERTLLEILSIKSLTNLTQSMLQRSQECC